MRSLYDVRTGVDGHTLSRAHAPRESGIEFRIKVQLGHTKIVHVPSALFRKGLTDSEQRLLTNRSHGMTGPEALVSGHDKILKAIASTLTEGASSAFESALAISKWIRQNIELRQRRELIRRGHPLETLMMGSGTTSDRAVLAVSMCRAIGIEAVLMRHKGQITFGIPNEFDDAGVRYRGKGFTAIEGEAAAADKKDLEVCGPWIDGVIRVRVGDENHQFDVPANVLTKRAVYSGIRQITQLTASQISRIVAVDYNYLKPIADLLCANCRTNEEKANTLLQFVQNRITYKADRDGIDSLQFPLESLMRGTGDCEDSALLYAGLCQTVGVETVLLNPKGHLAVGVAGKFSGKYQSCQGKRFYCADTTARGFPIGFLPPVWNTEIRVIPLESARSLKRQLCHS